MKQAIILAGGKGTRLSSVSGNLPKPMVPILDKPTLQYQIELCAINCLTDIHILVGYKNEVIQNYFGSGTGYGVKITYHIEETPRGTAGALLDIIDSLDNVFCVLYGDTYLDVSLKKMYEYHKDNNSSTTLFLHPNDHPADSDLVEVNSKGKITKILTYPHSQEIFYQNLVNAALYIFNKKSLIDTHLNEQKPDIAKHLLPHMLSLEKNIFGYISTEYIKDMGTPERLRQVSKDITSGKVQRLSNESNKRAAFLDRDGVINIEKSHLSNIDDLELLPNTSEAIRILNKLGILVVIVTNQPVVARGDLTIEGLRNIHNKLETLLGREGAYVDAIYYCPHHPDKGFHGEILELKIDCECRKPSTGMLTQAAEELNISLTNSYLVGDRTADIAAANKEGLFSILVKTGDGGTDGQNTCMPDKTFVDLLESAQWIRNNLEHSYDSE